MQTAQTYFFLGSSSKAELGGYSRDNALRVSPLLMTSSWGVFTFSLSRLVLGKLLLLWSHTLQVTRLGLISETEMFKLLGVFIGSQAVPWHAELLIPNTNNPYQLNETC